MSPQKYKQIKKVSMKKITITDDTAPSNDNIDDLVAQELAEADQDRMLKDDAPQLLFTDSDYEETA